MRDTPSPTETGQSQKNKQMPNLLNHPATKLLALLTVASLLWLRNHTTTIEWVAPKPISYPTTTQPLYESQPLPALTRNVHASQAVPLPDGRIAVFWFGGTKEGHRDVQIYRQFIKNGQPQDEPKPVLSADSLGDHLGIYVKNLGNPVPFYHKGQLHLFVVSVALGGWATAQVSHLISDDLGDHWHTARQPILSPFFNQSTLVRTTPRVTREGFIVPAYFEQGRINPMWLHFDDHGRFIYSETLPVNGLQPAIAPSSAQEADLLIRPLQTGPVLHIESDGEGNIEHPEAINPPQNPKSAVAVLPLNNQEWLMAHNPGERRDSLVVSHTRDGGQTWQPLKTIVREQGERFSYPSLTVDDDGLFHLFYTHKRERILYVRFNWAGLTE